jgi:hypothetical protein
MRKNTSSISVSLGGVAFAVVALTGVVMMTGAVYTVVHFILKFW